MRTSQTSDRLQEGEHLHEVVSALRTSMRSDWIINASMLALATTIAGTCGLSQDACAAGFTVGNLVVVRVGDGVVSLSDAAAAVFLEERLQSNGSVINTLPLPTESAGTNRRLTVSGSGSTEAFLTSSVNGQYLVIMGYDAAAGTSNVSVSVSAVVNRVIGRITIADGTINTSTALSDLTFNNGSPFSAITDSGLRFWCAGTGDVPTNGGVRFVSLLGSTTSAQVATNPTDARVLNIHFDGTANRLFASSASDQFHGISTVGGILPTPPFPVTVNLLSGFSNVAGPSNYDFEMRNTLVLYVADDRAPPDGGIQKWRRSGGTWALEYTLHNGLISGCRALTTQSAGGNITIFATTAAGGANSIVRVTDTGPAAPFSTLAMAPANTSFRGIRLVNFSVPVCPANIVNTGPSTNRVDIDDLLMVISTWGVCKIPCAANIVNAGTSANRVDVEDLLAVISQWGPCP